MRRNGLLSSLMSLTIAAAAMGGCMHGPTATDLMWSPEPHPDFALGPRLNGPGVDGINGALDSIDTRALSRRAQCLEAAGDLGSWIRTIWTPFVGPRFLTVAVSDQMNCGGAHPDGEISYYTFDRTLDDVVDWNTLWPNSGIRVMAPAPTGLAARTGSLSLWTWYVQAVARDTRVDPELRRQCSERFGPEPEGDDVLAVWLDGESGGLGMKLADLPHAAKACGFVEIMPAQEMARLGATEPLLAAMRAAPASFDYSEMPR